MVPFIVLLSTQMQITKMRSWKFIIKNNDKNRMAKSGFGRKFHYLKNLYFYILYIVKFNVIIYIF